MRGSRLVPRRVLDGLLVLDDPADGTDRRLDQPVVNALAMEDMQAPQTPDSILILKLVQAHHTHCLPLCLVFFVV